MMGTKIEFTNRLEWLEARTKFITATEISCLFSMNPYASWRKMFDRKRHPELIDNVYMKLGKILEPAVVKAVELELGLCFKHEEGVELFYKHEELPLSSTPDALGERTLLECKSTSPKRYEEDWEDVPPLYYLLQVCVQLMTVDKELGYLAAVPTDLTPEHFHDTLKLKVFMVKRKEDVENLIAETVIRGYEAYVNETDFERDLKANKRMANLLNSITERIL